MTRQQTAKIEVKRSTDRRRIEIVSGGLAPPVWFEIDPPAGTAPPESIVPDFALPAILPQAMKAGIDLAPDFPVDATLLEGLEHFQDVWHRWRPDIFRHKVSIRAEAADRGPRTEGTPKAVAAFSAGVDSSFMLARHGTGPAWPGKRAIAAAVMVHGFDMPLSATEGFSRLRHHGEAISEDIGVALFAVRTNWRETAPNWQMSFGAGLASVLQLFSTEHRHGLIATEESYDNAFTIWGNSFWNDRFFSRSDFRIESDGGAYDRVDRIQLLKTRPEILSHLSVCWAGPRTGENCGTCPKCVLTKLNFTIAGIGDPWPFPQPLDAEQVDAMPIATAWQARFLAIIEARLSAQPRQDAELIAAVRKRLDRAAREDGFGSATALPPRPRKPWWNRLSRRLLRRFSS